MQKSLSFTIKALRQVSKTLSRLSSLTQIRLVIRDLQWSVMRNLTSRVFEHLEITSPMDVDKSVNCVQRLLRGSALNKYKAVLTEFKESAKGLSGDQWTLGETNDVTMEKFWTQAKEDGLESYRYAYMGVDKCINFDKEIWFDFGNIMLEKHHSVLQDHIK